MIELQGKYNTAKVFTDNIEETAISQIIELCNQEFVQGSKIRIMPDCHAGAGCTIGTTMTITDKVIPNLVGVDIGCGMKVVKLGNISINLEKLDKVIKNEIPVGTSVRSKQHKLSHSINIEDLKCINAVNEIRAIFSIGTLGGGNHFIEINKDNEDNLYLVIHSGSRNLGKQVAEYYQELGYYNLTSRERAIKELVKKFKKQGRQREIENEIKKVPKIIFSKELAYVEGKSYNDYLYDMNLIQIFAQLNREAIAEEIIRNMGFTTIESFSTIHNYIDTDNMILRKGAISAKDGERVLIPINMRDGSLICVGKGNPDWNFSAPHGAGRLMSRSKAKEVVSLKDFKDSMKDIYTTSVGQSTLDESPMSYKPMQEIIDNIHDTVEVVDIIKPIYNFKAGE